VLEIKLKSIIMKGFNYKKAVQALNFFALKEGGCINKMKALKLVWLSDRLHLRRYSRTITGDVYFALPFGPVASTTRDILKSYIGLTNVEQEYSNLHIATQDKYSYESAAGLNENVFSETDLEVLSLIYEKYGRCDEFVLSEISHRFPEWKKYETALTNKNQPFHFSINEIDFFENYEDGSGLFMDSEEYLSISKEMYLSPV
jgi:uncharacterized phage-associated protein